MNFSPSKQHAKKKKFKVQVPWLQELVGSHPRVTGESREQTLNKAGGAAAAAAAVVRQRKSVGRGERWGPPHISLALPLCVWSVAGTDLADTWRHHIRNVYVTTRCCPRGSLCWPTPFPSSAHSNDFAFLKVLLSWPTDPAPSTYYNSVFVFLFLSETFVLISWRLWVSESRGWNSASEDAEQFPSERLKERSKLTSRPHRGFHVFTLVNL